MNRLPHHTTKIFTEIYPNHEEFITGWRDSGLYQEGWIREDSLKKLFYLLYAKYGNNAIANRDQEQFKYKVYAIIYQYAPTWQRKVEVQKILRELPEEELVKGSKQIYNHAFNPSSDPSTCQLEEIPTINDQNTTNYKKSVIEGYALLLDLLEADVTQELLNRFKPLFATFVYTRPDIYITEEEDL